MDLSDRLKGETLEDGEGRKGWRLHFPSLGRQNTNDTRRAANGGNVRKLRTCPSVLGYRQKYLKQTGR